MIETSLIGISLSMDAFAVTLSSAMVYGQLTKMQKLSMPVTFGIFQGLMPLLGFYLGNLFCGFIDKCSGVIAFLILCVIGINMLKEGIKGEENEKKNFSVKVLMMQAIATSIDAFAVGVSFNAMKVQILPASLIIACLTFLITLSALFIGKYAGEKLGDKSVIFGGTILIIIGIKSLLGL